MPTDPTTAARPNEIVAVLRMLDANGFHHLHPIALADQVDHLWIVRPLPKPPDRAIDNSAYCEIKGRFLLTRLWRVYRQALRLGQRPAVGAFVSFNPIPYGFLALLAGLRTGKPVHLGFVGSDWYRHCRAWYGPLLNRILRRADLMTVTGEKMKADMVAHGYDPDKIFVLPHAVDVDEFSPKPPHDRTYDFLFVGALIPRKRVDLILTALADVKQKHPNVKLCIVGDGPTRPNLQQQIAQLDLTDNVTFAGYQSRPAPWFSDARAVVIASDMEGFPFVLVEGICAGAIPVSTTVGTITDFINHERNGLLVPPNDAPALAQNLARLLDEPALTESLRQAILPMREQYRYDAVAQRWSAWLADIWPNKGT